jgi:hypothetical protein
VSADPERLLSDAGSDPLERDLLASVRDVGPPSGAKETAWRGLAGQIAAGVALGAAAASSSAAAKTGLGSWLSSALAVKAAAGLAVAGVAAGGYFVWQKPASPSSPMAVETAPRTVVPAPSVPKTSEAVNEAPPEAPRQAVPKKSGEPARDLLTAESALLTEARAELRAGNALGAQALLDRLQAEFSRGVLTQEREVLAVEVLAARGKKEAAKARARAFIAAHPKSPHSEKLARFLDDP